MYARYPGPARIQRDGKHTLKKLCQNLVVGPAVFREAVAELPEKVLRPRPDSPPAAAKAIEKFRNPIRGQSHELAEFVTRRF